MVRTLACFATLAGVSFVSANAQALFIFGPKKFEMQCLLSNEHPGAGGQPTPLATQILSPAGMGSATGRIHVVSKGKVLVWNAVATITVTRAADGKYKSTVRFTKPTGQLIYQGTAGLPLGSWGVVTWQDWPKSQGYLAVQCLVQKAR